MKRAVLGAAVLLAAPLMVMSACSDSGTSTPTLAAGTTGPPVSVTTTTPAPSTTSTVAESSTTTSTPPGSSTPTTTSSIPIPNTAGETDFEVIWHELMEYHNWAFENPEMADPTIYLSAECDCLERAEALLAEYVDNGWHTQGEGIVVHEVDIEVSSSTFALITVIDEQAELTVLGVDGETIETIGRRPKTFFDVRIRLTDDGWRIAEWNQRGAEGAAE
ncbi:MAG: hypothetical protein GY720_17185 [bacterium]|nr:hypothetical protein [bacterium]